MLKSIPQCIVMKFLGILILVALPDSSYRAWLWVSHNALFWESQTHSVNDSIIWFWLSISGNASKKLHCGNVVNMPYLWFDIIGPQRCIPGLALLICWTRGRLTGQSYTIDESIYDLDRVILVKSGSQRALLEFCWDALLFFLKSIDKIVCM